MKNKLSQTTSFTLSNGMPAVHIHCPGSAVAIFGLSVRAGSRNEKSYEHGLAHFVEHTIFKGTGHRRASHIINRMEAVGGELNAYTTKEETVIYSIFPSGNLARAVELIADLASDSRFPERELDKEREVVADEIDSYLDTPSEAIFDDFEDIIFENSSLGHNILGTRDSLRKFDSMQCRNFVKRNYTAGNMVAFYSGPRGLKAVSPILDRYLSVIPALFDQATAIPCTPRCISPFDRIKTVSTHQSHCIIGARVSSYLSPERYATALLTNILGGPGMNSLLNVQLRERHGLVYTVEASTTLFSDCGLMTIYFGCDPDDRHKCMELVRTTIDRLPVTLTNARLEAAKKQYLGQLVIASENRENSVLASARSLLWRHTVIQPEETISAISSLSADDIIKAAEPLQNASVLTFSPD